MTDQLQGTLASAYELIEADRLDEARLMLKPILAENIDNADAWWLYAHAVDDPETARTALNNVLRIDPDYPGAAALMSTLEDSYPVGAPVTAAETDPFATPAPASFDLADDLDLEPELDLEDTADNMAPVQAEPANRRPNWLLILILLVLIVVIIVLLLPRGGNEQAALTPTADSVPTVDTQGQVAPTIEVVVSPEEAAAAAVIEAALANDAVLPGSARVESTPLGPTMLVSVCTTAGDEMRAALDTSMRDLAGTATQMGGVAEAVGVRLIDCATEMTLRVIGVPASAAAQFAADEIDLQTYQGGWRALP
jgi:hypothetical protein